MAGIVKILWQCAPLPVPPLHSLVDQLYRLLGGLEQGRDLPKISLIELLKLVIADVLQ